MRISWMKLEKSNSTLIGFDGKETGLSVSIRFPISLQHNFG